MRCELLRLFDPHTDDGCRSDDENRRASFLGLVGAQCRHRRQDLNGLTQTHVISQNSTDATGQASRQPRVPAPLVRAQDRTQRRHRRQTLIRRAVAQRSDPHPPGVADAYVVGCTHEDIDDADLHRRESDPLTVPSRQGASLLQESRQRSNTFAVEAHPRSLDLDVVLPACDRLERVAHADRDAAEAQAHVEVEPVAFGRVNVDIDVETVFSHVDRTHVIRDIPHKAIDAVRIDNRVQECGNAPGRQPPRSRRRGPQGRIQHAAPRLDATHDLGYGLVAHAVGHRSAGA